MPDTDTATPETERVDDQAQITAAFERVMTRPAVDLADLAAVMGVHVSTVQRAATKDTLPVPIARIGQRWIVPCIPLREFLATGTVTKAAS